MRPDPVRLSRRHATWFYAVFTALLVSGVLWLVFHRFVRVGGDFGEAHHPLEPWWMKLHGAAAMLFLVLLGTLLRDHIPLGWATRRNRASGAGLLVLNAVLATTGWGLYYAGGEGVRDGLSLLHWGIGLGAPLALTWHVRRGRASRLSVVAAPPAEEASQGSSDGAKTIASTKMRRPQRSSCWAR